MLAAVANCQIPLDGAATKESVQRNVPEESDDQQRHSHSSSVCDLDLVLLLDEPPTDREPSGPDWKVH